MPRAHRLPAVRLCLLLLAAVLPNAIVLAPAASADPSRAAAASVPAAQPVSRRRASHSEASPARQAKCAAASHESKHRRARKACAVKKATAKGTKPSTSPRLAGTAPAPSSAPALAIAGPPPVEALAVPAPESIPPAESPGGSDKSPVELPVEPKASATTTLSSSLDPSMVGQAVTYTATVNGIAAAGSITFEDAGTAIAGCADQTVSSGAATCTLSGYAAAGTHSITATYSGDSNYVGSTSALLSQVVGQASTSTTLTSSANPSLVRQFVTYTARVISTAATGTVAFAEAGAPIIGCTAQPVSSGAAICTVSSYTAAGTHSIIATYSGDGNYLSSTSPSLTEVVDKTGTTKTTTTLSSSLNPSTVREAVTFTATLGTAAATGTVEFRQAGVTITGCSAQPVRSGTATCTVADLGAGSPWITAVYSGNSNFAAASSPGLTQTVNKQATTTVVSSSLDPSTVGEAITYTATVSTAAATGTAEFKQAGVTIVGCAAQPISAGMATCAVADPIAGWYGITAVYSGDSSYAASWSPGFTQTVNKKTVTTTVSSSLTPSTVGQAVTFAATVSAVTATGTVEFRQAGVTISGCSAQIMYSGTATCTLANLTAGWHGITAVYSGDGSYAASWSPVVTQTVNKHTTTTTVSSSANPSTVGHSVTYTATVSPDAATGTIEFKEASTAITGCAAEIISFGTATCTVTGYPKWSTYRITAAYSGDSGDLASSSMFTQTVEPSAGSEPPFRFFSPSSFWNEEVPADAELDPSSAAIVGAFDEEIGAEEKAKGGPWINATYSSVPVYTVPSDQPTVQVTLVHTPVPALQSAWSAVPLPPNAQPAAGGDEHLVVWQPSTDRLWEFWHLMHTPEGWQAEWGGAMQSASSDSGAYGPEAWPGAQTWWGASGTSLSIAGGLITLEDLERGQINHVLAMAVPNVRAGVYASPAERSDGESADPLSLPEGAHLRLDPNLNLAALHLPPLTLMIAEAAQRYGIIIRDKGMEAAFYAQDPIPTGTEPYAGTHGYFEGTSPEHLLESFPWSHLQLLKMELHSTP